ncbi:MAG: protein kinase domain-containing protein [Planctomycetota bacterium]|jgi:serine/threonine-protein kinase
MSLTPGQELTHYTITEKIGEGGMGEVWSARDTRLDREVAIKVLPPTLVNDKERLTRFEREARALAALNHPHIAQIFGVDQVDDLCFLVLEMVPGETLADRIAGGPLPVEEVLNLCRQLAEGLEAAHDAGIVHRDLKPANVRITPEGVVKILDFGLAKASNKDMESGETLPLESDSLTLTEEGKVLGTPTYMSPEQARGKRTDRRTDIWAFGCVMFELLAGQRTFGGETITDVLGAIVHKEPEWELLPPRTPTRVRELLRRCLSKDPRGRLRDIGDARVELEEILADPTATMAIAPVAGALPVHKGRLALLLLVAVLVTVGATLAVSSALQPDPTVRRFRIAAEDLELGMDSAFRISPDGTRVLYVASRSLWIRDLDKLEPRALRDTSDAAHPMWSPDGRSVGFSADGKLWRMPADGGPRAAITALPERMSAVGNAAWLADGTIVWSTGKEGDPLMHVSAGGGDPKTLLEVSEERGEQDFHHVAALPDSKGILIVVHRVGGTNADALAVLPAGATEPRGLLQLAGGDSITTLCYAPSGHVLYRRNGSNPGVWALPFSLDSLDATGEPFLAVPDGFLPTVSDDGTLMHSDRATGSGYQLVWVDRTGRVESVIGDPLQGQAFAPRLSPDRKRAAVTSMEDDAANLWVYDTERGSRRRILLQQEGFAYVAAWTPAGDQVLAARGDFPDMEMLLLAADGSGVSRSLAMGLAPNDLAPDGSATLVERVPDNDDIHVLPIDGLASVAAGTSQGATADGEVELMEFLSGPGDKERAMFSPDGRFVAYGSDESGDEEVYVTTYPGAQGKWLVFEEEGTTPVWSPLGDELFFLSEDDLWVAPISTEGGLSIGPAELLFDTERTGLQLRRGYDVSADGQRILAIQSTESGNDEATMVLVENWVAEFVER